MGHYVEQLTTTAETLRRRGIAYYDGICNAGKHIVTAANRLKDISEPAAMDAYDYLMNAYAVREPIAKLPKPKRDLIVELYLGIAVFLLGLAGAELSGAYALPPLLEAIFNPWIEVVTLVLVPIYIYLYTKKANAIDDTDRRNLLMNYCLWFGVLAGHMLPSLTSLSPSSTFVPPLLLALLIDNELLCSPLPSIDRQQAVLIATAAASVASLALGSLTVGTSAALIAFTTLHAIFVVFHMQVSLSTVSEKAFSVIDTQLTYIAGVMLMQLLTAALLGRSPLRPEAVSVETKTG